MPGPVRKPTRRTLSLLFIALFLTLATVVGLASYGLTLGRIVFSSVQYATRTVGGAISTAADNVVAFGKAVLYAQGIYNENESLRQQNRLLDSQTRLAADGDKELARLQAQLAIQQQLPVKTILAQVTGRGAGTHSMDIFIDHGTTLGIRDDVGALVADNTASTKKYYVYGKVKEVSRTTATVVPILDSRCVLSGINTRSGEDVLVKGTDKDYCDLSYVSPLPHFQAGDVVVTSSSSSVFPANIPIGYIDILNTVGGGTRLVLRPFAPVWSTRYVFIMLSSK